MITQLTHNLENAYRVDLNHSGDYRFDLEGEHSELDWCSVVTEPTAQTTLQTQESEFARSFKLANSSSTGNNAGYCTAFRTRSATQAS